MWSAYLVSIGVSALSLCVLVPASRHVGLLDYPNARKLHRFATPLVGGLAIFLGLLAGWFWFGRLHHFDAAVLATACGLVVLGAFDDRYDLPMGVRLTVEVLAILTVIATTHVEVRSLGTLAGHELTLGWLSVPFTIFAVIGLINAFNLMDGIDGLAGGLALVSAGAIALLSPVWTPVNMTVVLFLLAAALYPYLVSNLGLLGRHAKVFLGDSGSIVVGYVIAWTLIVLSQSAPRRIAPGLVLWCVAVPVFDTFAVMYRRLKRGTSPFAPDRTHIHYLLMKAGVSPHWTLVSLLIFAAALPFVGVWIRSRFGAVANLEAFVGMAFAYGAVSNALARHQTARAIASD